MPSNLKWKIWNVERARVEAYAARWINADAVALALERENRTPFLVLENDDDQSA